MAMIWFTASFSYYVRNYERSYMPGTTSDGKSSNHYFFRGVECFGFITSGFLMNMFGMKKTLYTGYFLVLLGVFLISLVKEPGDAGIFIFIMMAEFGISMVFNIALCGNYYLFPYTIISTTMGICGVAASLSEIFAPKLNDYDSKIVLCVVMLLAIISTTKIVDELRDADFSDLEETIDYTKLNGQVKDNVKDLRKRKGKGKRDSVTMEFADDNQFKDKNALPQHDKFFNKKK